VLPVTSRSQLGLEPATSLKPRVGTAFTRRRRDSVHQRRRVQSRLAEEIRDSIAAQEMLLEPDCPSAVADAAELLVDASRHKGKVLLFGNGGSAADAEHRAGELLGRYQCDRAPLPAIALAESAAAVTAIGKDYSFEHIFACQIEALAVPGDVAVAISTTGTSANVLAGPRAATRCGIATIGLTGGSGGGLTGLVDVCIRVPSSKTPRIREAHALISHALCSIIDDDFAAAAPG
jgi:D-sedoheptulose 7-phosphate isomerase